MPESAISSVLTEESNQHSDPIETFSSYSRRGFWPELMAARRLYAFLDERKPFGRDDRLWDCRRYAWFARHIDTGQVRVISNNCHLRWCPMCGQQRKNYITHNVSEWIRTKQYPKFLTLTLRHSDTPLYFQIKELYDSFVKLRRMKFFKNATPGGIWFFQVKKSKTDSLWHPHLHCLIYGDYIPIRHLKRKWAKATSGSHIVDIRPIKNIQGAANEVARYGTEPGSLIGLPVEDAAEMASALQGRRVCGTWGTGRAVSLRPPVSKDKLKWKNLGNFSVIYNNRDQFTECHQIVKAWRTCEPLAEGINMCDSSDQIMEVANKAQERSPPCLF